MVSWPMTVGTEWLVDASGCPAERLRDVAAIRAVMDRIVAALDLRVVGEAAIHQFPDPGGVTALYLLTESPSSAWRRSICTAAARGAPSRGARSSLRESARDA
jgi:S-adenosylmethionine/arginine decarboxylase-like enzyme